MNATQSGDRWAVGLAPRALGELKKFKRNHASLDIVWEKFRELSSGRFTSHNHSPVNGTVPKIPIYTSWLNNDLRIVYQIDIIPDKHREHDHQVIKILRIIPRAHVDFDFWVRVSNYLYRKYESSEYQKRCKFGGLVSSSQTHLHVPYKFPHDESASSAASTDDSEDNNHDEVLVALGVGRYVAVTKSLYNQIVGNKSIPTEQKEQVPVSNSDSKEFHPMGRINLPPDPDVHQHKIVNHRGASIVIGRSGTGKTTALIYKMNSVEESATTFVRQMLVTRSPVLAKHVESSYRRLADSFGIESEAAEELGESPKDLDQALIEFDNEADLRDDLPARFSLLDNSHFPLFISFAKLCSLIQADMYEEQKGQPQYVWSARRVWELTPIGYKEFKEAYWPRFRSSDRYGLNASLVYSEILGVIKGYSQVMGCSTGCLSEDQYTSGGITARVSAHLDTDVKTRIYSMFKDYRKLKGERFELDQGDQSHRIHEFLNRTIQAENTEFGISTPSMDHCDASIHVPTIDYLYVDEVQDNLMTDIRVLRGLCKNVDNTYWGGDTAQTILAGSAFRINDLGSYIHNEVYDRSRAKQKHVPSSFAPSKFELTINYRSHEGLVQFAASIVDSLYSLFPDSLDHLDREAAFDKSTKNKPVVFSNTDSDVSIFEKFLMNSASSLGAQQAILVRSEETVHELNLHIAEFCPIMTIPDSKGLEFDDVLLYNFFAESDDLVSWEFVHGRSGSYRSQRNSTPPLSLCNELKLLYVAITRARQRCWIWDHGSVIDAMKLFWEAKHLVSIVSVTDTIELGRSSNSAQWIMKGQEYFANGMYKLAAGCFERGGPEATTSHRIAMAYYRMSQAKLERIRSDSSSSRESLCDAAKELGRCAEQTHGQSARHLWFHSAICLELAHKILESADAFVNAGLYERAIRALLDRSYYKRSVKILLEHGHNLDPKVKEELLDRCRRYYFEKNDYSSLPPLFYNNLEDQLSYARKNGFWKQFKYLLEHHKLFDQLAHVHIEAREVFEGLEWLFKAFEHHHRISSLNAAAKAILEYAGWNISFESKAVPNLVNRVGAVVTKVLSASRKLRPILRKELNGLKAMLNQRLTLRLVNEWDQNESEERLQKAQFLHALLHSMDWLKNRDSRLISEYLDAWGCYNGILLEVLAAPEPSKTLVARKLFAFRSPSSDFYATSYVAAENSMLSQCAPNYPFTLQHTSHNEPLVPARWVDKIVKDELVKRMSERNHKVLQSSWTTPRIFKPRMRSAIPEAATRWDASEQQRRSQLRVLDTAIKAFAPVCHIEFHAKSSRGNPNLVNLWVRRLFDFAYPSDGSFEELIPSSPTTSSPTYSEALACIRQLLLHPSPVDISTIIMVKSLLVQLGVNGVDNELGHLLADGIPDDRMYEKEMVDALFDWENARGLQVTHIGLKKALQVPGETFDAAIMVHLIEMITAEVLFHARGADSATLARRYEKLTIVRDTGSISVLIQDIVSVSDGLKNRDRHHWWIGAELLHKRPDMMHILQLRLCWCISLLIINSPLVSLGFSHALMNSLVHIAEDPYDRRKEPTYHRFSRVIDQASCLQILCETLNHEPIVGLLHQNQPSPTWRENSYIKAVPFAEPTGLLGSLRRSIIA